MRSFSRAAALLICLALILSLFPAHAASNVKTSLPLSPGLEYTRLTQSASTGDPVQLFTLTYTPGGATRPMVVYGDSVYGAVSPEDVLAYARTHGYTPVAAVNADFFTMSTGVPEGLLVTDGVLRCSDSYQNAVGIRADGSIFLGTPQLRMTLEGAGKSVSVTYINKLRTTQGVYLLTPDFDDTTHLTRKGTNVWLKVLDNPDITIGGTVSVEVESISESAEASAIPEGYMLLTAAADGPGDAVKTLAVGDRLTLSVTSGDTRWNEAVYACGAGAFLVADGKSASGLSTSLRPVTALGLRADGSAVVLAADGRQSGYSAGFSLADAAVYLASQGCVTAVNLDGGGSTTIYTRNPGYADATLSNVPSDGSVRKCANYLVFANTAAPVGTANSLWIYPSSACVLAGASLDYEVLAADPAFHPAALPGSVSLDAGTLGSFSGTRFTAANVPGSGTVTASAGSLTGSTRVTVCTEVDSLTVTANGRTASSLTLEPGQTIELDVVARVNGQQVVSNDTLFDWSVSGSAGTVSPDGTFTAGSVKGLSGTITVSYGSKTREVSVTVGRAPSLLDGFETISDWLGGDTAVITLETDAAHVRYGYGSARVDYTLTSDAEAEEGSARLTTNLGFPSSADYLNFWVDGSAGMQIAPVITANGEEIILTASELTVTGWQQLFFTLPDAADSLTGLVLIGPSDTSGSFWLDSMSVSPGTALSSRSTLELTIQQADTDAITATVRDTAGYVVSEDRITLRVDGAERAFTYDADSGRLIADEPVIADGRAHRVTLTASDCVGNLTRVTREVEATVTDLIFADMDSHWALTYANALNARGIMNGETSGGKLLMNPGRSTTRQEMATLMARYLGLDLSVYELVELPFADAGKIASWALPYVRAMYAEGLMQGSSSGGKLYFNPTSSVTRAEVMAILGRTLPQGYAASDAAYADAASVPAWAAAHLDKLVTLGVIGGYPDNTVRAANPVTRAEVATMLYRLG